CVKSATPFRQLVDKSWPPFWQRAQGDSWSSRQDQVRARGSDRSRWASGWPHHGLCRTGRRPFLNCDQSATWREKLLAELADVGSADENPLATALVAPGPMRQLFHIALIYLVSSLELGVARAAGPYDGKWVGSATSNVA